MRSNLFLLMASALACANSAISQTTISITAPKDGARVNTRQIIEGKVSDPRAAVWVIVHPLEVSDYWVQPAVTVQSTGLWKVEIHAGREGVVDRGKLYEIKAVANPKESLKEGAVLSGWPSASGISEVLEVKRK